jgi:spore coat protein CotH
MSIHGTGGRRSARVIAAAGAVAIGLCAFARPPVAGAQVAPPGGREGGPSTRPADGGGLPPGGPFGGGPFGGGPPGGPVMGGGGPMGQTRQLVKDFDKDGDGRLNDAERAAARASVKKDQAAGGGRRGPGGFGGGFGGGPNAGGPNPGGGPNPNGGPNAGGPNGAGPDSRPAGDVVVGPGGGPNGGGPNGGGPSGGRPGGGGFGGRGGPGGRVEPAKPGPRVAPADVTPVPAATPLYDAGVLRTLFLTFPSADWEAELADFNNTDVDVPATLVVDGKTYPDVGVHFRGNSSYFSVPAGSKRSLNLSLDYADDKQRLLGQKTLNLLNNHEDPSMLRAVLFNRIAGQFVPTPKANFVKVVINGESWGVYTNAQQFNKEFAKEWFPDDKPAAKKADKKVAAKAEGDAGKADKPAEADKAAKSDKAARWKVPGSPGGRGGLTYLGDDPAPYRRLYQIKSADDDASWKALIGLCKVLNQTPPDKLADALAPILDVDGALWFLALDDVFANGDGYWTRGTDYSIYRDHKGKFHVLPQDTNETFSAGGGPGGGMMGGPGGGGGGFGRGPRGAGNGGGNPGDPSPGGGRPDAANGPAPRPAGAGGPNGGGGPNGDGPNGGGPNSGGPTGGGPNGGGGAGGFGGQRRGGFGGPGGGMGGGVKLDPLVGLDDPSKPLRSKLLAVPALRASYLAKVRLLAEQWLDWDKLKPIVDQYRSLIEAEVKADTKKLEAFEAFERSVSDAAVPADAAAGGPGAVGGPGAAGGGGPREAASLKAFVVRRRAYLLDHPEVKKAAAPAAAPAKGS